MLEGGDVAFSVQYASNTRAILRVTLTGGAATTIVDTNVAIPNASGVTFIRLALRPGREMRGCTSTSGLTIAGTAWSVAEEYSRTTTSTSMTP